MNYWGGDVEVAINGTLALGDGLHGTSAMASQGQPAMWHSAYDCPALASSSSPSVTYRCDQNQHD